MIVFLVFFFIGMVFGWYRYMRDRRRAASTAGIVWLLSILGAIIFRILVYRETGIRVSRLEVYFLIFMPLLLALLLGYFAGEFFRYIDIRINGETYDVRGGRVTVFFSSLFGRILPARHYEQSLDPITQMVTIASSRLYAEKVSNLKRLLHSICFVLRVKSEDKFVIMQALNLQSVTDKYLKQQFSKIVLQTDMGTDQKTEVFKYIVNVGVRSEINLLEVRDGLRTIAELLDIKLPVAQQTIQEIVDRKAVEDGENVSV